MGFSYCEILLLLENTTMHSQVIFFNHEILTFTPVGVTDSLQFVILHGRQAGSSNFCLKDYVATLTHLIEH